MSIFKWWPISSLCDILMRNDITKGDFIISHGLQPSVSFEEKPIIFMIAKRKAWVSKYINNSDVWFPEWSIDYRHASHFLCSIGVWLKFRWLISFLVSIYEVMTLYQISWSLEAAWQILLFSHGTKIRHAFRQYCFKCALQISERFDHDDIQSCSLDALRDFSIRCSMA